MRQQKMADMEGGVLDGWGVKQVKKQNREKGLKGNGVKGAGREKEIK